MARTEGGALIHHIKIQASNPKEFSGSQINRLTAFAVERINREKEEHDPYLVVEDMDEVGFTGVRIKLPTTDLHRQVIVGQNEGLPDITSIRGVAWANAAATGEERAPVEIEVVSYLSMPLITDLKEYIREAIFKVQSFTEENLPHGPHVNLLELVSS